MQRVVSVSWWIGCAALIVGALAASPVAQEIDLAKAARMPMAEFQRLHRTGKVLVIDVRDPVSYANGHIPGAKLIPLGSILEPKHVAELKAATVPIVIYCA